MIGELLEPELWVLLQGTYSDADEENSREALVTMCQLFRVTAKEVASHFGFVYPQEDDEKVSGYMRRVQVLPRAAETLYKTSGGLDPYL